MSPLYRATKVFMADATNQIFVVECVIDWRNVWSLEDDGGAKFPYHKPRTLFITSHGDFFLVGTIEEFYTKMQQWEAYAANKTQLLFSRN